MWPWAPSILTTLVMLPRQTASARGLALWWGRFTVAPFVFYFFILFVPFLPLAVLAVLMAGAGFLILKGRFLTRDELIAAFVEEAEGDFVEALATGSNDEVKSAFDLLQTMAQADGTYSEMEGDCLVALVKRVSSARTRIFTDRFPQLFAP